MPVPLTSAQPFPSVPEHSMSVPESFLPCA